MLKNLPVFLMVFSGLLSVKRVVVRNGIETALEVLCSSKLNFQFLGINFQNERTVSSKIPPDILKRLITTYQKREASGKRLAELGWTVPMNFTMSQEIALVDPANSDEDIERCWVFRSVLSASTNAAFRLRPYESPYNSNC